MLDRKHRLPQSVIFKDAKAVLSQAFLIKTKTSEEDRARIGVVVSKKVEAKAVGRNKIKRQVRSYIEKNLHNLKKGQDILIIARKDARDKTTKQIGDTLEESLKKAKVLI